jgi:hypothetical protein
MCLFFDPYTSDDQRRYASRLTFLHRNPSGHTSQEGEIFFLFSRARYILWTTSFSDNNTYNNYSDAALTGRRRQELKPHYLNKVKMAFIASEYMVLGD